MVFWRRKKKYYPLPRFPHTVAATFRTLCENIPVEELTDLRQKVLACYEHFMSLSQEDENFDLESAQNLLETCDFLISQYENFSPSQRALIIGAVRYVAIADDPFDDAIFASGFNDDIRVVNHVLEELGVEGRFISLD